MHVATLFVKEMCWNFVFLNVKVGMHVPKVYLQSGLACCLPGERCAICMLRMELYGWEKKYGSEEDTIRAFGTKVLYTMDSSNAETSNINVHENGAHQPDGHPSASPMKSGAANVDSPSEPIIDEEDPLVVAQREKEEREKALDEASAIQPYDDPELKVRFGFFFKNFCLLCSFSPYVFEILKKGKN